MEDLNSFLCDALGLQFTRNNEQESIPVGYISPAWKPHLLQFHWEEGAGRKADGWEGVGPR